jgi:hypothetical protein
MEGNGMLSDLTHRVTSYACCPSDLHRDLTEDRLRVAADRHLVKYRASAWDSSVYDAMAVGALRGAAASRRHLSAITRPTDALFGATQTLDSSLWTGAVPNIAEVPWAFGFLVAGPQAVRLGTASLSRMYGPLSKVTGLDQRLNEPDWRHVSDSFLKHATTLCLYPSFVLADACKWSSLWCSASAKLLCVAPGAAFGAITGASLHYLKRPSSNHGVDHGARGARNDKTFAGFEPVSRIPDEYFFITEERLGLDVRELWRFFQARGRLVNPYTNLPFSLADAQRLERHPSGFFAQEVAPKTAGSFLLSGALWTKYLDFFVDFALLLGNTGPNAKALRKKAYHGLLTISQQPDAVEVYALKLFFESISDAPWQHILEKILPDASASQDLASRILTVGSTEGALLIGDHFWTSVFGGKGAPTHPEHASVFARHAVMFAKVQFFDKAYLAARHPYLAKLGLVEHERLRVETTAALDKDGIGS